MLVEAGSHQDARNKMNAVGIRIEGDRLPGLDEPLPDCDGYSDPLSPRQRTAVRRRTGHVPAFPSS